MKRKLAIWSLIVVAVLATVLGVLCGFVWWSDTHPIPDGDGLSMFMMDVVHHAKDGTTSEVWVTAGQAGKAGAVFFGVAAFTTSAAFLMARRIKAR